LAQVKNVLGSPRCSPLFQDTRLIENAKFMQISTKIQMCIIWVSFVGLGAAENSQAGGLSSGNLCNAICSLLLTLSE